jgi:CheY-like chemotaxis protein
MRTSHQRLSYSLAPILLIEDDADSRDTLAELLGESGYSVLQARSGAEALALLRSGYKPSLILLDLMMPIMSGFEFREIQRRDPELMKIPVVVISGAADQNPAELLKVEVVLQKPFSFEALLEVVARYVPTEKS